MLQVGVARKEEMLIVSDLCWWVGVAIKAQTVVLLSTVGVTVRLWGGASSRADRKADSYILPYTATLYKFTNETN